MQTELTFYVQPSPAVLTFTQFIARGDYDAEISHDMLRFPHGISKRQARDNKRAAGHHLSEAFRAARDYQQAVDSGMIRPPSGSESHRGNLGCHPDHESVKASWRVAIKRMLRAGAATDQAAAVSRILSDNFAGIDPWAEELGGGGSIENQVNARLVWLNFSRQAAA